MRKLEPLSLTEYKRLFRLASEFGDRIMLDQLMSKYLIDDGGAHPVTEDEPTSDRRLD